VIYLAIKRPNDDAEAHSKQHGMYTGVQHVQHDSVQVECVLLALLHSVTL